MRIVEKSRLVGGATFICGLFLFLGTNTSASLSAYEGNMSTVMCETCEKETSTSFGWSAVSRDRTVEYCCEDAPEVL